MSSILRINASRANGAKSQGPTTPEGKLAAAANSAESTGPTTPEGKAICSHNATRHGLLADSLVLEGEAEDRFTAMLSGLENEFQPANTLESHQIENMAVAHWRRMRIWSLEKAHYIEETKKRLATEGDDGAPPVTQLARTFRSLADHSNVLELLGRYESRFSREYSRALACFNQSRDRKNTKFPNEVNLT